MRAPAPARPLRIAVTGGRGRRVAAAGLAEWLARVAPGRARGEVAVALVTDARIRALNRRYRGVDTVTDVLSFPAAGTSLDAGGGAWLGDVVIGMGRARRQAREAGHPLATELRVLALHGLLHLLGFDHDRDRGAMGRLERRLRRKGGLREGLIERGGARTRRRASRR